jgi:hypothetical protein
MDNQTFIQTKFFNKIGLRFPDQTIVKAVMELLNLRKGAAYKRMNGETALTTEELIRIANHFDVSLDNVFFTDKFISFSHPFLYSQKAKSIDFLSLIAGYLETLTNEESSELIYLSNELPFFYYVSKKHIFTFLYSMWNHLHWEEGGLMIANVSRLDKDIEKFRTDISNYYDNHPVTEIWNPTMFSNLYQQIIFCITIKAFDTADFIRHLVIDIEQLLNHLRDIAMKGKRHSQLQEKPIDLKLYINEFGSYHNVILHKGKAVNSTFLGFDYPHFIVTKNDQFYHYAQNWVAKIKQRSVLISGEGFQQREQYFEQLKGQFQVFKSKVENLLLDY